MTFPNPRRIRQASLMLTKVLRTGTAMMIEMRTKRRWIVSVLDAVAEQQAGRTHERVFAKRSTGRGFPEGQKGFAMRLKAATRPLSDAAR
jgi:hypothetical protein